jgi:hypothetical protein
VSWDIISLPRLKDPGQWASLIADAIDSRIGEIVCSEPAEAEGGVWEITISTTIKVWGGEDELPYRADMVRRLVEGLTSGHLLGPLACIVGEMKVRTGMMDDNQKASARRKAVGA